VVVEVWLVALGVQTLEVVGRATFDDASDVVGVLLLLVMLMMLLSAAKSGRARLSHVVLLRLGQAFRRGLARLEPAAGVAFRLPRDPPPLPWAPRRGTLLVLGALALAAAFGGGFLLPALEFLRTRVAYTPYLLALLLLWAVFGIVTTLGLVAVKVVARPVAGDAPAARMIRSAPWVFLWLALLVAFSALPGWVALALFLLVALGASRPLLTPPPRPYWLWRRDERGQIRAATLQHWIGATWWATVLFLLFVVLLAQAPRLLFAVPPAGRFGLTVGLGLAATSGAILLVVQAGRFLARTLPGPGQAPESPLRRTLWWPGAPAVEPAWLDAARLEEAWRVTTGPQPPAEGYDLVMGRPDTLAVVVPETFDVFDALFRLHRRLHVTKRREFFRRFQVLYKEITRPPRVPGAGYLFCPHAWPVPSVIRDGTTVGDDGRAVLGGVRVGRPYAEVFPPRCRRYLAEVFGALDIDLIYWDDRVAWAPLRAVLGVVFESYDQGRVPLDDRDFRGLTRVRAIIQEPEDLDGMLADPLADTGKGPAPLRARVLVLRRDDGGERAKAPARQPGTRVPAGSLS